VTSDSAEASIPIELKKEAYEPGGELAWSRENALKVIDVLTMSNIAILGGEVWLPTRPGPTIPAPIIYCWDYTWDVRGEPLKSWPDFVKGANARARSYVIDFVWDPIDVGRYKQEPYFNFALMRGD
jgi:hypothetical protein